MENNRSVSTQGTERTTTEIPNKEQIKADASGVSIKAKNIGREQIESGKQTAASEAEQFPMIEQAASQLTKPASGLLLITRAKLKRRSRTSAIAYRTVAWMSS
jgi:hypothetical protein